ncbi:MAG: hypothetical protein JW913_08820, partial [Chitinispirillaceae bacterium]|nr:hypothetical protein [Chitinispirillaceae bacterium]
VFLRFSHVVFPRHLMHRHQKESLNLGIIKVRQLKTPEAELRGPRSAAQQRFLAMRSPGLFKRDPDKSTWTETRFDI